MIDQVEKDYGRKEVAEFPAFRAGDTLVVHSKIVEGNKSRVQAFQGVCIGVKAFGKMNGHFRVRKISSGMGVERLFPFHCPNIEKIEVKQKGKVRRAKLYYLRDRSGKSARIAVDYDRKEGP